jgi:hypothetical protein
LGKALVYEALDLFPLVIHDAVDVEVQVFALKLKELFDITT